MTKTQVIFFGTHNFATTILQTLIDDTNSEVVCVVTQPDKPVGRKQIMTAPPVKILAESYQLPIYQPETLKGFQLPIKPTIIVVAEYGLIIPPHILSGPKFGCINVHTSLLPKYRGASPIQTAILNGDTKTGVTIMLMDRGLDTGPILSAEEIDISKDETAIELERRLSVVASPLLIDTIHRYIDGEITPKIQTGEPSFAPLFDRDIGRINWTNDAITIYNQYRALTPWPGVWTKWRDKRVKLIELKPSEILIEIGKIITKDNKLYIGTKTQALQIITLQIEGKKILSDTEFLSGYKNFIDDFVV